MAIRFLVFIILGPLAEFINPRRSLVVYDLRLLHLWVLWNDLKEIPGLINLLNAMLYLACGDDLIQVDAATVLTGPPSRCIQAHTLLLTLKSLL
jgi:hypothetical protein